LDYISEDLAARRLRRDDHDLHISAGLLIAYTLAMCATAGHYYSDVGFVGLVKVRIIANEIRNLPLTYENNNWGDIPLGVAPLDDDRLVSQSASP